MDNMEYNAKAVPPVVGSTMVEQRDTVMSRLNDELSTLQIRLGNIRDRLNVVNDKMFGGLPQSPKEDSISKPVNSGAVDRTGNQLESIMSITTAIEAECDRIINLV